MFDSIPLFSAHVADFDVMFAGFCLIPQTRGWRECLLTILVTNVYRRHLRDERWSEVKLRTCDGKILLQYSFNQGDDGLFLFVPDFPYCISSKYLLLRSPPAFQDPAARAELFVP